MRVRILGAGIIGLVCADELIRRGHELELVDSAPGSGASSVAAGLLSPSTDTGPSEDAAFRAVDPRRFGDHAADHENVIRDGPDGNHPA